MNMKDFPADWTKEKILVCAQSIVADSKNPRREITGQVKSMLTRPHKFIVDGVYEGIRIRVVIEPDDRGILEAYPLD
jgi:hypothetical protein